MSLTPNLAFDLQTHLGNVGAWDTPLNSNFTALDAILGGVYTKSVTGAGAAITFTSANCYANVIRFSGTLAQTLTVTFTTTVVKSWVFENTSLASGAGFNVLITMGSGNVIALPPGACQAYFDGTNMGFMNLGQVGGYLDLGTTQVPSWIGSCTVPPYLNCIGGSFSAVTYPVLNAHLGGNTLPDFRGRSRSYNDAGAGRITFAASGITGTTLGSGGGAQTVTIGTSNLPAHGHTITDPGHVHAHGASDASGASGGATTVAGTSNTNNATTNITINATGGNAAMTVISPTAIGGITLIRAM